MARELKLYLNNHIKIYLLTCIVILGRGIIRNSFYPHPTYTLPIPYDGSLEAYRNEMLLCPRVTLIARTFPALPCSARLCPQAP